MPKSFINENIRKTYSQVKAEKFAKMKTALLLVGMLSLGSLVGYNATSSVIESQANRAKIAEAASQIETIESQIAIADSENDYASFYKLTKEKQPLEEKQSILSQQLTSNGLTAFLNYLACGLMLFSTSYKAVDLKKKSKKLNQDKNILVSDFLDAINTPQTRDSWYEDVMSSMFHGNAKEMTIFQSKPLDEQYKQISDYLLRKMKYEDAEFYQDIPHLQIDFKSYVMKYEEKTGVSVENMKIDDQFKFIFKYLKRALTDEKKQVLQAIKNLEKELD